MRNTPGSRRRIGDGWLLMVSLPLILLSPSAARALINLHYTPVELVHQSELVLRVTVELGADGRLVPSDMQAIKGESPKHIILQADTADGDLMATLATALGDKKRAAALVFSGDFSAAVDADSGDDVPVGALYVGTTWFALKQAGGGAFTVAADPLQLKSVWAGDDTMLERIVAYVQQDVRADVPVRAGISFGASDKIAAIPGKVHRAMAVDLHGDGRPCLLVLADSGDRVFRAGSNGSLEEITAQLGLSTQSTCAAAGDFNGDGRLDLALGVKDSVSLHAMGVNGKLSATGATAKLTAECLALAVFQPADTKAPALLVSTTGAPELVAVGVGTERTPKRLGAAGDKAGPCVLADFDADRLPDVVQPRADGLWMYGGQKDGRFADPVQACDFPFGEGLAATIAGDYDADGLLDLLVVGRQGCFLASNQGQGKFREVLKEAGEVAYNARGGLIDAAGCDINNDGREEFVLMYAGLPPQLYFNRGFRCFGYALDDGAEIARSELPGARAAAEGQQAGAVADFDGDGAQDLAYVTTAGELWLLRRDPEMGARLGLSVALVPGTAGPVSVTGQDGNRSLGTRVAAPGLPAFFGKRNKGPLDLQWSDATGRQQSKRVILLRPTRVSIPADEN